MCASPVDQLNVFSVLKVLYSWNSQNGFGRISGRVVTIMRVSMCARVCVCEYKVYEFLRGVSL